jgi:hypothetical protein
MIAVLALSLFRSNDSTTSQGPFKFPYELNNTLFWFHRAKQYNIAGVGVAGAGASLLFRLDNPEIHNNDSTTLTDTPLGIRRACH